LNTLDFMKDIIIYLSNLSQAIELPGKEEALSLLHFLLAFAPLPPPATSGGDVVMFAPYQPSVHRYLPPAVDSLAKLLARDEPNRTYYRAIFTSDGTSSPPFDLLTRTFGLAISPIPEHTRGNLIQSVEARKPYLVQGMLAAEILANLAPGPEFGLARSWLSSEDGFALSLLRLVCLMSTQSNNVPQRHLAPGRMAMEDPQSYHPITHRGMAVLRRLAEKSKNPDDLSSQLPVGILPRKENLLGALLTSNIDSNVVRQLCAYAGLEN
jgi:SWI/SNF chromatin-remodeling complex subunit SWI1